MMPSVLNTNPIHSVSNITDVGLPNVLKMTKTNNIVTLKSGLKVTYTTRNIMTLVCQKHLSVGLPTGVRSVPTSRLYQTSSVPHLVYQNSLRMMPSVLNTDLVISVPKCNWCTKLTTVPIVPKMIKIDPSVPKRCLVYQQNDYLVYQPVC